MIKQSFDGALKSFFVDRGWQYGFLCVECHLTTLEILSIQVAWKENQFFCQPYNTAKTDGEQQLQEI